MTERARIREEYKKKKRLPAPEIPKSHPHSEKNKKFILEERYKPEIFEKEYKGKKYFLSQKEITNEWKKYRKYSTKKRAENAMAMLIKNGYWGHNEYEYRIVEVNDGSRKIV